MKKKPTRTSWSQSLYNALEHPRNRHFKLINGFLTVVTLISVAAVILETTPQVTTYFLYLQIVEYISVAIFSFEYLLRVAYAKPKRDYVFSFFGIIDILAILPSFFGLANLTFLKSARSIRVIRTLRALRLAKMARFDDEKEGYKSVLGINFEIYIIAFALALILLGSGFYIFESKPEAMSIPSGMYWALRIIVGGIPYPQPETIGGLVTIVTARFTAMVVFGMVIGVVGTILRIKLTGSEKDVK